MAVLLLLSVFAFYAATLRAGHVWDDDAAMYILHGRNLAEGRPYAATGYIFNPDYANLGPPSYPPGFPLLLAPIWATRGLDLGAMKLLDVLLFTASLGLLYLYFRPRLGSTAAVALVALVGFNPVLWSFKESVTSDFAFLPFVFLAFLLADRAYTTTAPTSLRNVLPIALAIAAATSIRSIGFVLVFALIAAELLSRRRISRATLLVTLAVTLCYAAESLWMRSLGGTPSLFRLTPRTALNHVVGYAYLLRDFWDAGNWSWLGRSLYLATFGLALQGCLVRWRSRSRLPIDLTFAVAYMAVLLVYMPIELRFLFPVFPIFVALAIEGLLSLLRSAERRALRIATATALLALTVAYAAQYRRLDWGPIRESFLDDEFMRTTSFIRSETSASATLLFRKPRLLALTTGRSALTYAPVPGLGSFARGARVDYVVVANEPRGALATDRDYLWPFLQSHNGDAQLVYRNAGYSVYRTKAW